MIPSQTSADSQQASLPSLDHLSLSDQRPHTQHTQGDKLNRLKLIRAHCRSATQPALGWVLFLLFCYF